MKNDYRTHRAPYYGGEKFARTLQEAFGPYTDDKLHVKEDYDPVVVYGLCLLFVVCIGCLVWLITGVL